VFLKCFMLSLCSNEHYVSFEYWPNDSAYTSERLLRCHAIITAFSPQAARNYSPYIGCNMSAIAAIYGHIVIESFVEFVA
jgi:hypothetical protein